jgi:uncharacterized protein (DUF1800 family)
MNWAEYILQQPKTLDERRMETSAQFRKERQRKYDRKRRAAKKMVQQLLEKPAD